MTRYAVFAQAAYWQDTYGVAPPPTVASAPAAPAGAFEIMAIQDNDDNYIDLVESVADSDGSTTPSAPSYTCISDLTIPDTDAKAIASSWSGKAGQKATLPAQLECTIAGLSGNSQAGLCGPAAGGEADYGDMAKAFQSIVDNCDNGGNVGGNASLASPEGFYVMTYADGIGGA